MATLNVQEDYGAAGDGSTDDTRAINDAILDAEPGDTVYLPAGTYLVNINSNSSGNGNGTIQFHGPSGLADVTFEGDGEETIIEMEAGQSSTWGRIIIIEADGYSTDGLVLRNFRIEGNGATQSFDDGRDHAIATNDQGGAPTGVLLEDIYIHDTSGSGIFDRFDDTTVRRVTVDTARGHGLGFVGSTSNSRRVEQCLITDCSRSGYHGIDANYGHFVIEDTVCENGQNGLGGTKWTANTRSMTVRRCRFSNNTNQGLGKRGSSSSGCEMVLENVVCNDNSNPGFVTQETTDVTVPSGSEVVANNNGSSGIAVNDGTSSIESDGTIYSFDNSGDALNGGGSGYVSSINHNGSISSGSISIQSEGSSFKGDVDAVPTADEVGAWSDGSSGSDDEEESEEEEDLDRSEEQFENDFGAYAGVDTLFEEWAPQWSAATDDFDVVEGASEYGETRLVMDADSPGRRALAWDDVGQAETVEMVALVEPERLEQDLGGYCRLYAYGGGTDGSEDAYYMNIRNDSSFALQKYQGGDVTVFDSDGTPESGTQYWLRFRIEPADTGVSLMGKFWDVDGTEPAEWTVEATDTDSGAPEPGWVGVGGYPDYLMAYDYLGVGIGGAEAPIPQSVPEETHQTDFEGDTFDSTPENWTPVLSSSEENWTVTAVDSEMGTQALEFDGTEATGQALRWDAVPADTRDVEILQLVRVPSGESLEAVGRIRARFDSTGYTADIQPDGFRIYDTSTGETLGTAGSPSADTWYWVRFRLEGEALSLRAWEYGTDEPDSWDIEATDSTHDSGWVGVGSYQPTRTQWNWVSVGTGGASAPVPESTQTRGALSAAAGSLQSSQGVINTR